MISKKHLQSQINLLNARKNQAENTSLFSKAESEKMIKNINIKLQELVNQINVVNPIIL
ncbi:hypothetical protein [Tenacibaculum soleae]|uniref:hypothetical protein n=1 Tax=Tenacibaculum soleae TaxID=447689 RepID=UPI002300AEB1|nr:hypothetical protein [Tenacibaculum soleae]